MENLTALLIMWAEPLFDAVKRRDDGFYAALARQTELFLTGEDDRLSQNND